MLLKSCVNAPWRKTPFRLIRAPLNRFQAIEECLTYLKGIQDHRRWGAHLGGFAALAEVIFPGSAIHVIEPQPACQDALASSAGKRGLKLHAVALAFDEEPGKD